jgi:hypothetical protein
MASWRFWTSEATVAAVWAQLRALSTAEQPVRAAAARTAGTTTARARRRAREGIPLYTRRAA